MNAKPVLDAVITPHAEAMMSRRGLTEEVVRRVIEEPEQREEVRKGRHVLQARLEMGESNEKYLVRVFVDIDRTPPEVVTAYRTSKIDKYWRDL
jgi:hypothetical protein